MTDLKTLRQTLRDLAGKASEEYPLECEPVKEGFVYDCPLCDGGQVESEEAVTAFSQYAAGVQVFGIGASLNNLEAYVNAANPENILRLLDALEEAEARPNREAEGLRSLLLMVKQWRDGADNDAFPHDLRIAIEASVGGGR